MFSIIGKIVRTIFISLACYAFYQTYFFLRPALILTQRGEVINGTVVKVEQRRVEQHWNDQDRPTGVTTMDYEDWQAFLVSRKGSQAKSNRGTITLRVLRSFVTIEYEASNQKLLYSPLNAFDVGTVKSGQKLEVIYDPENPKLVKLNDEVSLWGSVFFPGISGIILLLMGLARYPSFLDKVKNYDKVIKRNDRSDDYKVFYFAGLGLSILSAVQLLIGFFLDVGTSKLFVFLFILGISFLVGYRHFKKS